MILINKGQGNTVALTLTEKTTISDPVYYLFHFQQQQKNENYYFIAADTSQYPIRYNLFNIVETSNPDPLAGEVSISLPGRCLYFIYAQNSATNLDPEDADELVEQGFVEVKGSASSTDSDYTTPYSAHVYKPA